MKYPRVSYFKRYLLERERSYLGVILKGRLSYSRDSVGRERWHCPEHTKGTITTVITIKTRIK